MKKLFALSVLAFFAVSVVSCKRTYQCKCKVVDPVTGEISYTYATSTVTSSSPSAYKHACDHWGDCERQRKK